MDSSRDPSMSDEPETVGNIGTQFGPPEWGFSDADIVRVLHVIAHTVVFIFTERPINVGTPRRDVKRYITAARIGIHLSLKEVEETIDAIAEQANFLGTVQRIKIWTNRVYDGAEYVNKRLLSKLPRGTQPADADYYHFNPESRSDGLPWILRFSASQYSQRTSFARMEEFRPTPSSPARRPPPPEPPLPPEPPAQVPDPPPPPVPIPHLSPPPLDPLAPAIVRPDPLPERVAQRISRVHWSPSTEDLLGEVSNRLTSPTMLPTLYRRPHRRLFAVHQGRYIA